MRKKDPDKREARVRLPCGTIKPHSGKCCWVIMRDDCRAIFEKTFQTRDSAVATMEFENLSGYHLEHRFAQYQDNEE